MKPDLRSIALISSVINNQELLATRVSFKLGVVRGSGKEGIVAEERNAAVLELRTLLLESESESIVSGSEMAYSHRRR